MPELNGAVAGPLVMRRGPRRYRMRQSDAHCSPCRALLVRRRRATPGQACRPETSFGTAATPTCRTMSAETEACERHSKLAVMSVVDVAPLRRCFDWGHGGVPVQPPDGIARSACHLDHSAEICCRKPDLCRFNPDRDAISEARLAINENGCAERSSRPPVSGGWQS